MKRNTLHPRVAFSRMPARPEEPSRGRRQPVGRGPRGAEPHAARRKPARGGRRLRPAEVDATPLDLRVDGVRPTATVVIDTFTRAILGWHLS